MRLSQIEALGRLEYALSLARQGRTKPAGDEVKAVREGFGIDAVPGIAVRALLAESIIANYESDWKIAGDKLLRARHLSRLFGERSLYADSLAWSATVCFNQNAIDEAVDFASGVFSCDGPIDPSAESRAASLIGIMFELVGCSDRARHWFSVARRKAELGSESSLLSTIIFDYAAARVSRNRFDRIFRSEKFVVADTSIDDIFVASSSNFDSHTGVQIMPRLHSLLMAQSKRVRGASQEAIEQLDEFFLDERPVPTICVAQATVELALAAVEIHRTEDPGALFSRLMSVISQLTESDEAAIAHYAAYRLQMLLGDAGAAESYLQQAQGFAVQHKEWQSAFQAVLEQRIAGIDTEALLAAKPN